MKEAKRMKAKHVLTEAPGPHASNALSPKPFKGFRKPVQAAGKRNASSSLCLSQVTHYPPTGHPERGREGAAGRQL